MRTREDLGLGRFLRAPTRGSTVGLGLGWGEGYDVPRERGVIGVGPQASAALHPGDETDLVSGYHLRLNLWGGSGWRSGMTRAPL